MMSRTTLRLTGPPTLARSHCAPTIPRHNAVRNCGVSTARRTQSRASTDQCVDRPPCSGISTQNAGKTSRRPQRIQGAEIAIGRSPSRTQGEYGRRLFTTRMIAAQMRPMTPVWPQSNRRLLRLNSSDRSTR